VCLGCGHRFFTNETVCEEYPIVIKRNGKEEEFDRDKVKIGLSKAFKKSANIGNKVDEIYARAIGEILSNHPNKICSETIGMIIMGLLKASDPAAYLRFASVYKNFETADDFAFEFRKMSSAKEDE
jgi:transcriptional repressor NrdR